MRAYMWIHRRVQDRNMGRKLRAGILGYGRMGRAFVAAMQQSGLWEIAAIYDIKAATRTLASQRVPGAAIYDNPGAIFADSSIDALGLFTLADARPDQVHQALANGKHVLAEKPMAADIATECQLSARLTSRMFTDVFPPT